MNEEREKKKRTCKIVGLCMLIGGAVLFITGLVGMFFNGYLGILAAPGVVLAFCSIGVITIGFRREIVQRGKDEMMPILQELKRELAPADAKLKCTYCGAENEPDGKFCKECGKPLYEVCPHCGAQVNRDGKFCDKCGIELKLSSD